jgi:hypothetical protein
LISYFRLPTVSIKSYKSNGRPTYIPSPSHVHLQIYYGLV